MEENQVTFGTLHPDGTLTNVRMMKQSTFANCPFFIIDFDHYREDGTCKCDDENYRKTVMKKWGYTRKDFKRAGLI